MPLAQPLPQRTYIFQANTAAVGDQVNKELDTLYNVLQGGLGDVHIASNAQISGSKIALGSIPSSALAEQFGFVPVGGIIEYFSDGGALPTNFRIMDGSTVSDTTSPLNGVTLPNTIGKNTRGVGISNLRTSPVTGGSDSVDMSHSHPIPFEWSGVRGSATQHNHTDPQGSTTGLENGTGPGNVSNGSAFLVMIGGPNGNFFEYGHSHGGNTVSTSLSVNTVSAYVGFCKIIRIK